MTPRLSTSGPGSLRGRVSKLSVTFRWVLPLALIGAVGCGPSLTFTRKGGAPASPALARPESVRLADAAPPRGWESIGTVTYKGTCDEVHWLGTDRNVAGWSKEATARVREEGARQGCTLLVLGTIQRLCDDAVSSAHGSGVAYYAECMVGRAP